MVSMRFAAAWTFYVQNLNCARVQSACVETASGLDQRGIAFITKPARELRAFALLNQRLAAGDFNQFTAVTANFLHHFIDRHLDAASERVFAVAPRTTEITPRQSYENTGQAGE